MVFLIFVVVLVAAHTAKLGRSEDPSKSQLQAATSDSTRGIDVAAPGLAEPDMSPLIMSARAHCQSLPAASRTMCMAEGKTYATRIEAAYGTPGWEPKWRRCEPRARTETKARGGTLMDVLMLVSRCMTQ